MKKNCRFTRTIRLLILFVFPFIFSSNTLSPFRIETITLTPIVIPTERLFREEIMETINQARREKNLPALRWDESLANAADQQAAYLAKIGKLTEKGLNNESAKSIAADFGYGGGSSFQIEQCIAMSWSDTEPSYIVKNIWLNQAEDRAALLNEDVVHIGVGESLDVGRHRYVVAYLGRLDSGTEAYTPLPTYDQRTPKPQLSYTPTAKMILISTPNPDGSIIHKIQEGETLSEIAYAYHTDWDTLSNLNDLDLKNPVIIEGQDLLIRPKFTQTLTPTVTETPRPPTRTPRPTFTTDSAAIKGQPVVTPQPTETELTEWNASQILIKVKPYRKMIGIMLIVISACGLVFSFILRKHDH